VDNKIFVSVGGSGTTYFVSCLQKKYAVDVKPDTYLVLKNEPISEKKLENRLKYQRLSRDEGCDVMPTLQLIDGFASRTGFIFDRCKTIKENLLSYIELIKTYEKKIVLFNSLAKFGFFSKNKINDVVYLVRHPLCSYLSFTKIHRHFRLVEPLGGIDSKKSIKYYLNMWRSIVSEYLSTKEYGANIICYEFFHDDAYILGDAKKLFNGWDTTKRNWEGLSRDNLKFFKSLVYDLYNKVYDEWNI